MVVDMLREAVAALAVRGEDLDDVLAAYYLGDRRRTPATAHALGVLEGAGVVLGLTARELLEAFAVMPPATGEASPAPGARTRRTARRAVARRASR